MDPVSYYLRSLYEKSNGYRPTWLPHVPLKIGDIGVIEDGVFVKEGNLEDVNIPFKTEMSSDTTVLDLSSENGISITAKASGKVDPKLASLGTADAGFLVEFKNDNSYIFKLNGTKTTIISNLGKVKDEILERFQNGQWPRKRLVINELVEAKASTILLAGKAGTTVELKAEGSVNAAHLDIADGALNLRLASGSALTAQILGKEGITPLYRVIGITRSLFSTSVGGKGVYESAEADGEGGEDGGGGDGLGRSGRDPDSPQETIEEVFTVEEIGM